MRKSFVTFFSIMLSIAIIFSSMYYSLANSIDSSVIRESIKSELLTGFIYDDNGNKTEIFNTILRLTKLDEETVIKLMENETANEIITDIVNSIYDYNLTGDASYKYTGNEIIDIVNNNIDKILSEINYNITDKERNDAINWTKTIQNIY